MKIKTITVENFKSISEIEANFDGCSAIITGGNNKGKSSLLHGLIDRMRSEKPSLILKEGEKKGFNIIELTDGSRIEWKFTEKTESFAFITKEGIKQTTGVLKAIGERYFGIAFDIDRFLNSSPKEQSKQLQALCGLDFSEIDIRYKEAYDDRTFKNRTLKELGAAKVDKPEDKDIRAVDVVGLELDNIEHENAEKLKAWDESEKTRYDEIEKKNDALRREWRIENEKHLQEVASFNEKQRLNNEINENVNHAANLVSRELQNWIGFAPTMRVECEKMLDSISNYNKENKHTIATTKELKSLPEPEYSFFEPTEKPTLTDTTALIAEYNESKAFYEAFTKQSEAYESWVAKGKQARKEAEDADNKVKEIEAEKQALIESAKLPEGFAFSEDGILFNGFPLDSNQISSSQKYIAGLKLGAMVLGEIKTLHFDASFLDKNSLSEVQNWANENDLQLLIERPDFDGGEITYNFI